MQIPEQWSSNPGSFAVACIAFIPMAVWMIMVIGWTVQGDLDPTSGILACFAGLTLGYFAINPPVPSLGPLFLLVMLSTMIAYPMARAALNQRELSQMDIEQIEIAYEKLKLNPNDGPTRIRLAKAILTKGLLGQAIGVMDTALRGLPPQFYRDEARLLQRWQKEVRDPKAYDPMPCVRCGAKNPNGEVFCSKCQAPFLLDHAKGRIVAPDALRRVMAFWLIAVILIAGLPTAAAALPPSLAILVIVLLVGLAAYVAVRTLKTTSNADLT